MMIKKKDVKEKEVKQSKELTNLIKKIGSLSVLGLADLVKALEKKFGVSATPVATAAVAGHGNEDQKEEKSSYDVNLKEIGGNKISVIKAVREINQNLGLKEAKDLVESAPVKILKAVDKEVAEEAKGKLEKAGGKVILE